MVNGNEDGKWYSDQYLDIIFFFDLDINEVAMRIHRILKHLHTSGRYKTIVSTLEVTHRTTERVHGAYVEIPKHTLLVIASKKSLNKHTIAKIIDKMFQPPEHYNRV